MQIGIRNYWAVNIVLAYPAKKGRNSIMNDLVQRLSEGDHPVTVGGPKPSLEEFRKRVLDMGYVFIKFTGTRGGTDLGVRVEKSATDVSQAFFEQATGVVHVEGTLTLNYVKVRCVADINLETLNGTGHLVILEEVHP
jgi:hypothetical protein